MNFFRRCFLAVSLFATAVLCCSWGALVHRTTSQLAIYQLKNKPLQQFFFNQMPYFVKNSTRPDDRRRTDTTEATKHFIDLEMYGEDAANKMPLDWENATARYSKDSLLKYGYVPYEIIRLQQKLTEAFRMKNKDSIMFIAADLAHYIEDANVPLHTSVNYDGQLTNQKGLHALWESLIPELEINTMNLKAQKNASYLAHPEEAIWKAIRHAHLLVKDVFAKETDVSLQFTDTAKYRIQNRNGRPVKFYTTAFAKAYSAALAPTINEQLILSANLVADFWYTAWVDGGKPDMLSLMQPGVSQDETAVQLKKEIKSYRKNNLIADSFLIAKNSPKED